MKYLWIVICSFFMLTGCDAETLNGQAYQLENSQMPITLAFEKNENRYHGQALNNYFGSYEVNGNQIKFNLGGSTMMAGSPEEMQEERAYYTQLEKVISYHFQQNHLILTTSDGQELIFKKQ